MKRKAKEGGLTAAVQSASPIFDCSSNNGLPELMELVFYVPQGGNDQSFLLGAETRFGSMTVALDDYERVVEFGLSKATLRLQLRNCEIEPSYRLGDAKPSTAKTKVDVTSIASSSSKAALNANLEVGATKTQVKAAGGVGLGAQKSQKYGKTDTSRKAYELEDAPIISLPGNRWLFSAVGRDFLQSKYSGDDALCTITVTSQPAEVTGHLSFYPKDLFFIEIQQGDSKFVDFFRGSLTKPALAKVLLAKYLRELNDDTDAGQPIKGTRAVVKVNDCE